MNSADVLIASQSTERPGEQKPAPNLHSQFNEGNAVFSPDARWVAYESDESGRQQVYVQTFPLTDQKYQISSGGGSDPAWRRDGAEVFYLASDRNLMAVPVRARGTSLEPGVAESLFPVPGNLVRRAYAPSADGHRFLVPRPADDAATVPVTVVLNWQSEIGE